MLGQDGPMQAIESVLLNTSVGASRVDVPDSPSNFKFFRDEPADDNGMSLTSDYIPGFDCSSSAFLYG